MGRLGRWLDKLVPSMPEYKWLDAGTLEGNIDTELAGIGRQVLKDSERDRWHLAHLSHEPKGRPLSDDDFKWHVLKLMIRATQPVEELRPLLLTSPAIDAFQAGHAFFVLCRTTDGRRHAAMFVRAERPGHSG